MKLVSATLCALNEIGVREVSTLVFVCAVKELQDDGVEEITNQVLGKYLERSKMNITVKIKLCVDRGLVSRTRRVGGYKYGLTPAGEDVVRYFRYVLKNKD